MCRPAFSLAMLTTLLWSISLHERNCSSVHFLSRNELNLIELH
jgi:hypothetical protein